MTAVEATSETFKQFLPNPGAKVVYIQATTTNATDYITVPDLTIVQGFWIMSSGGLVAAGTCSTSTNIITLSNGSTGTKIWSGLAWGY